MKSFKMVLLAGLLVFAPSVGLQAQGVEGKKVGYVDLSRLFDDYTKTKEYDAVLEKKHSEYEAFRNKKLDKIRDAQGKMSLLKDTERTKLQEQMDKDRNELLEFDRQSQTELKKDRDEKIREILLEIEKVVREFAEQEKFSLIFNDRVLIYGGKEMDITEKVLKQINDSYKKGTKESQDTRKK